MDIPIYEITIKNRGRKDLGDVSGLAASIKDNGLIQPIVVRRPRQGEEGIDTPYVLVAGGRRFAAHVHLGRETIRSELLDDFPEWKQVVIELEENIQRKEMTWHEVVEMRLRIKELYEGNQPGITLRDLAAKTATGDAPISTATFSRDIRLAEEIRRDPTLKNASSKKAAVRVVEFKASAQQASQRQEINVHPIIEALETADMRDYLRAVPTHSVDLLFSDLPYGIDYFDRPTSTNLTGGGGMTKFDDSKQNVRDILVDAVPHMIRTVKPTGWMILMMQWENYFYLQDLIHTCCAFHYDYFDSKDHITTPECKLLKVDPIPCIWYRPNSRNNPEHPELHVQNQYELILVCNMGAGRIKKLERIGNVLAYDSPYENRIHAHQKPDAMCREVIERLTLTGDLVMDICYGSGALLRAAYFLGRRFRGCDLNPINRELAIPFIASAKSTNNAQAIQLEELEDGDDYDG